MTDPHTDEETQEQPSTSGGLTAPQDVDNPGERTTPPARGDEAPERIENAREDQDRTLPQ